MDKDVIPVRGQIVVVRNDPGAMVTVSGTDDGDDEVCYIMQRAAGGGTVLGGTYQKGRWESQPDPNEATRIMKRAIEICPALTGGKGIEALSVIRHGVGLRPLRTSGVRVEREKVDGLEVVHNYGHGGWGMFSFLILCVMMISEGSLQSGILIGFPVFAQISTSGFFLSELEHKC